MVIYERGEPIPIAKTYDVQNKNCNLTGADGATGTFAMEDENETSDINIKDATSLDDITSNILAVVTAG